MRIHSLRLLLALTGLALLSAAPHAHGTVPPPHPPLLVGAPPLPTRGTPTNPGSPRPAGPRAPGTGPAGSPTPGSHPSPSPLSGGASGVDLSSWFWWWQFNREPFLQLRAHLDADRTRSGSDGYFLGRGDRAASVRRERGPTEEEISRRVVPSLLRALTTKPSNDLATACLIAIARVGNDRAANEQREIDRVLRTFLRDANQEVSETAVVALGILGTDSAALLLGDILLDGATGRSALDTDSISDRTRAFAAYSLAVLGNRAEKEDVRRYVVSKLALALDAETRGTPDLPTACVIALGRVPLAWRGAPESGAAEPSADPPPVTSREGQVHRLLAIVGDHRNAHRTVRAHAAAALGALLAEGDTIPHPAVVDDAVEQLVRGLGGAPRASAEITQSCAIALGMIGDDDEDERDAAVRAALLEAGTDASDRATRFLSLLALGRVGARRGSGAEPDLAPSRERLLGLLGRGRADARHWAALSLAILERGRLAYGESVSPDTRVAIHEALRSARSPADVAAFGLATGLLHDPAGGELLTAQLAAMSDDTSRGFVAIGLGLLEERSALETLRPLVQESAYRPALLQDVCVALALLADREIVDVLIENLREVKSLAAQASIARALGRIGGSEAVEPLLKLISDSDRPDAARALAAIALGLVADRDELPWNSILSVDSNYLAAPATLLDQQGFGILNIL